MFTKTYKEYKKDWILCISRPLFGYNCTIFQSLAQYPMISLPLQMVNSSAFFEPVLFNFNSIKQKSNGIHWNRTEIELEWNINWTEIQWKLRTDNECSIHLTEFLPLTILNLLLICVQFQFNFHSISVQFSFNFCLVELKLNRNWMEIKLKLKLNRNWTGSKKSRKVDPISYL